MIEDGIKKFNARFFEGGDWSADILSASTPQAERTHFKSSIQGKLKIEDGIKMFNAKFFEGGDWSAGVPPASTPQAERAPLKGNVQGRLMIEN